MSFFKKLFGKKTLTPSNPKSERMTEPKQAASNKKSSVASSTPAQKSRANAADAKQSAQAPKSLEIEVAGKGTLKVGSLIVSRPGKQIHPTFKRAVILLFQVNEKGCAGLVLNKVDQREMSAHFPGYRGGSFQMMDGGPVNKKKLYLYLNLNYEQQNGTELLPNLYIGAHSEKLVDEMNAQTVDPKSLRVFDGCTSWNAGQLEQEIQEGDSWEIVNEKSTDWMAMDNEAMWLHFNEDPVFNNMESIFPRLRPQLEGPMEPVMVKAPDGKMVDISGSLNQEKALPVCDGLEMYFAIDSEIGYTRITPSIWESMGSPDLQWMKQCAEKNMLGEIFQAIRFQGDINELVMVTAGGNHEAAMITSPELIRGFIGNFKNKSFTFAVPARDLLFCAPGDNPSGIEKIKAQVRDIFGREGAQGLLSRSLFHCSQEGNLTKLEDIL